MAPYLVGCPRRHCHVGLGQLRLDDQDGASGQRHLATGAAMHRGDASA